jgi:hypothetical protein
MKILNACNQPLLGTTCTSLWYGENFGQLYLSEKMLLYHKYQSCYIVPDNFY